MVSSTFLFPMEVNIKIDFLVEKGGEFSNAFSVLQSGRYIPIYLSLGTNRRMESSSIQCTLTHSHSNDR